MTSAVWGRPPSRYIEAAGLEFGNGECDDIERCCSIFELLPGACCESLKVLLGFRVVTTGDGTGTAVERKCVGISVTGFTH